MFRYTPEVVDRFPGIRAGVGHLVEIDNDQALESLEDEYRREQAAVLDRLGDTPLSDIPSIAAWRSVFSSFGVKPTQYRNAAEALLRRLTKKGDIPSINPLVDIGNLVSIRYALPVAFFDLEGIAGSTKVTFAAGNETFTGLGSEDRVNPEPGEAVFVDEAGVVSARRWCWRQSAGSATSAQTDEALLTVEGHHDGAESDVRAALEDLTGYLERYRLARVVASAQLSADAPGFDSPA